MEARILFLFCINLSFVAGEALNHGGDAGLEIAKTYPFHGMFGSRLQDSSSNCLLCDLVAGMLVSERRSGMTNVQIQAEVIYFCTSFKIEEPDVCEGIIERMIDILAYVVDHNNTMDSSRICGLVAGCDAGDNFKWSVKVPVGHTVKKPVSSGEDTFKILHITDIHYDYRYTAGKTKNCKRPLCCQDDQADGEGDEDSCGPWGEYGADVPLRTLLSAFENTKQHKFDYVYVTGDIVSHRVWSTGKDFNSKSLKEVYDLFAQYYDVPVYPVVGNHEAHPVNQFASNDVDDDTISSKWLYDLLSDKWSHWLDSGAQDSILKGGYYTVTPRPGFRLIVINNNVCIKENWWLLDDDYDPYGQLKWLGDMLQSAEENNEVVHILAHVPTGSDYCIASWSHEFNRIIERFSNTIAAQFYGHAHKDELYVFYSQSDFPEPINVGYNGASLCPDKSNPSYKIFEIDSKTYDVVDFEEWTFNLTAANEDKSSKSLKWYKLYSFKDAYGLKTMSPKSIDELMVRMAKNHTLIDQYWRHVYRNGDSTLKEGCNEDCQRGILCQMAFTDNTDRRRCNQLLNIYNSNL